MLIRLSTLLLSLILSTILVTQANAQTSTPPDSARHILIPGGSYSSDFGAMGMVNFQRHKYDQAYYPFKSRQRVSGFASTNSSFQIAAQFEFVRQSGVSTLVHLHGESLPDAQYFGLGNASVLNKSHWKKDEYSHHRTRAGLILQHEMPIIRDGNRNRLSWNVRSRVWYQEFGFSEAGFLQEEKPFGWEGGWWNSAGIGLAWDTRSDVFRPQSGSWIRGHITYAPSFAGNISDVGRLSITASHYRSFHLIRDITIAGQINYEQITGNAPWYMMPSLGGEYNVRGFTTDRFRGNSVLNYTIEARTWLFELPILDAEVGGQIFVDGGRVQNNPFTENMLQDHKLTVGVGGAVSVFSPNFIIRGDIGFSKEMYRIYTGIGYTF